MSKTIVDRKADLDARLAYLGARLAGIDAELDTHEAKDWEEMAVEREDDEMLEDLGQSAQDEVRMITAALQRVAQGSYGECTQCGSAIAAQRLDLLPATPFCKDCAPR